ncbi:hypothetical protein PPACK8108_LOCUS22341 [Phakopsora pachyrhizi]|uniref:Chromo domain-containing protein n=1 Tax=Phakopsora pachyrhizi TaxID=170000 RepID=A0AAV0BLN0_PHAPC|nr:hypothetical protein PPACK8108_LOCUS22341 [Phakopsora pachyrhizi]
MTPLMRIKGFAEHCLLLLSQILDSRFRYGKLQYLVERKGYLNTTDQTSWEPADNLDNAQEVVRDFHQLYWNKPKPGK